MNYVPRPVPPETEIAEISEIVRRHPFPDFVTGFDVRLGEFDGDPAMWVVFRIKGEPGPPGPERDRRVSELRSLSDAVSRDLLDTLQYRFPYFRYEP